MGARSVACVVLGIGLLVLGVLGRVSGGGAGPVIPVVIGASLVYLGLRGGRRGAVIFGHGCIVAGCYLVAWGIYLVPVSSPTPAGILQMPLFWGLFSIFGGICANFHAFCSCVQRMAGEKKAACGCTPVGQGL